MASEMPGLGRNSSTYPTTFPAPETPLETVDTLPEFSLTSLVSLAIFPVTWGNFAINFRGTVHECRTTLNGAAMTFFEGVFEIIEVEIFNSPRNPKYSTMSVVVAASGK